MSESPSLGTLALLLIRLDGRADQMVPVHTLAQTHRMSVERVRAGLQALWDQGYVHCEIGPDGQIHAAQAMVGRA